MVSDGDSVEVELRVGMLDLALAKLMTEDHHTIEFPTILLPENVEAGSIVKLQCRRALQAEAADKEKFFAVQQEILDSFAKNIPVAPVLRSRNITQTSVVLEWDPIQIATAELHYMALYKGDQRLGLIPQPLKRTATKVSNLEIDAPYDFRLVLSTSAGDFESNKLNLKTHKMTDLTGVVVCLGSLAHSSMTQEEVEESLKRLGCNPPQDSVKLDTTHFICTTESGPAFERAVELNIPIVTPQWLKACENERRLVSVRGYYLSANPPSAQSRPPIDAPQRNEQPSEQPSEQQLKEHSVQDQEYPFQQEEQPVQENTASTDDHVGEPGVPSESDKDEAQSGSEIDEQADSPERPTEEPLAKPRDQSEKPVEGNTTVELQTEEQSAEELSDKELPAKEELHAEEEPVEEEPAERVPVSDEPAERVPVSDETAERVPANDETAEGKPDEVQQSLEEPAESAGLSVAPSDTHDIADTLQSNGSHEELSKAVKNVCPQGDDAELMKASKEASADSEHDDKTASGNYVSSEPAEAAELSPPAIDQEAADLSTERELEKELEEDPSAALREGEEQKVIVEQTEPVEPQSADVAEANAGMSDDEEASADKPAASKPKKNKKNKKNKKK